MHTVLSPNQCLLLADALPDTPETVISISQLRRGMARAWVVGKVERFETAVGLTAVIEDLGQPGEPFAFSHDPQQIADLLPHIPDWFCVNVSQEIAPTLTNLLESKLDCSIRMLEDVYHTLTQPPPPIHHPQVRLLTPADLSLLENAPEELQGTNPRRTLLEMAIAGAIVDGRLVAIAQNYARSDTYGEIGVYTLPEWRKAGLATTVTAVVARYIQSLGLIPVWSCGASNHASLRVAQKLGFTEVSRRVYLIV
jgi:GNAT superfamily N-acetyltransferase